ncbi:MAG: sigma-70 family RNA polymerase sigma factor [Acidobacteriota bacterium]|nr:sigma-70 family RNA polymerase sigma factor [Acidobacteriota bacterium]
MNASCSTAVLALTLARISGGDDDALAELYDCTSALVFGLVRQILDNPAVAEEVTMDIYLQVWRQAKSYDANRSAPRTWLLMIARSRAIDSLRAIRHEVPTPPLQFEALLDDSPSAEDQLVASSMHSVVRSALQVLKPGERQAIELAFYSGMTHSAIAAKLGKPLGTVKSHIRQGMLRLRGCLENDHRLRSNHRPAFHSPISCPTNS